MVYSTLFQKLCVILVTHWAAMSGGNSLTECKIIRATYGKHYPEVIYISKSDSSDETRKESQLQNLLFKIHKKTDGTGIEVRHYAQSSYHGNVHKHYRRSKRQVPQQVVFLAPSANKTALASDTLINNIFTTLNKTTTTVLQNQNQKQTNRIKKQASTLTRNNNIANVINNESRNPLQGVNSNIVQFNPTLTRQVNPQNNGHRFIPNNPPLALQTNPLGSVPNVGINNQVRRNGVGNFDSTAQHSWNQRPISFNFSPMNRPVTSSQHVPRRGQISTNGRFANFDPVPSQRNTVAHRLLPSNHPTPHSRGFQTDHSLNTFHGRFMRGFEFGTPLLTPQLEPTRTSFDNPPTTGVNNRGAVNGLRNSMNSFPVSNSGMGLPFQQFSVQGFF